MSSPPSLASKKIIDLINNLKKATSCKSAEELISSYRLNQIEYQRTFHLKLLMNHSKFRSFILRDLSLTNQDYKTMIESLTQDFDTFNLQEIGDFLNWYRRSLSAGCPSLLSVNQLEKIFKFLEVKNDFPSNKSVISQYLFNFSALNILNEGFKNQLFNSKVSNFYTYDICLILKGINLNPEYLDTNFLTTISKDCFNLFNYSTSLKEYLTMHKYYSLVCKNFEVPPNEEFLKTIESRIKLINYGFPTNSFYISRIFIDYNRNLYNTYRLESLELAKNDEVNLSNSLNLAHCLLSDQETSRSTLEGIMMKIFQATKKTEHISLRYKSKIMLNMARSKIIDSETLNKCLEFPENSHSFQFYLLKLYFLYPEITGKSLLTLEQFKKYEKSIEDSLKSLDFIYLSDILNIIFNSLVSNHFGDEVKSLIEKEIKSRASKDKILASYYSRLHSNQYRLNGLKDHLKLAEICKGLSNK